MRTSMKFTATLSGLAVVLLLGGCASERDSGSTTGELERDLQLAVNIPPVRTGIVSAIEGGPVGAPSGTASGQRDAVVTPKPASAPRPAAVEQETVAPAVADDLVAAGGAVQAEAEPAPVEPVAEEPAPEPVAEEPAPEPVAEVITVSGPSAGSDRNGAPSGETGRAGEGRRGGGWGGLIGAVIRAGAIGVSGGGSCETNDRRVSRTRRGGGSIGNVGSGVFVNSRINQSGGRAGYGYPVTRTQVYPRY